MLFIILIVFIVTLIYFADKYYHNYWREHNVTQKETTFILGNLGEMFNGDVALGSYYADLYDKFKFHSVLGVYCLYRPELIINHPEIIQDVLIKNFNNFHDRGVFNNEELDLLSSQLFSIEGHQWNELRVKFTPLFSSEKLKEMFPIIQDVGESLQKYLIENKDDTIDMHDLISRYTLTVISNVFFGMDYDSINNPNNVFRAHALKSVDMDLKMKIVCFASYLFPKLLSRLHIRLSSQIIEDFFVKIVQQTVDFREASEDNKRHDVIQMMIELKNQGCLADDENQDKISKKLTMNELIAQAYIFFCAGYETSSSTAKFCLFEISRNAEIQKKVQHELDSVNEITFETLNELKYLECCIDETLRKYPVFPILNRKVTEDYYISCINLNVEKGTPIIIPLLGIHRDPNIYDEPMKFKPERFLNSPHGNGKVDGVFYSPFGDGPRRCIAAKMGKLQTKIGLAMILKKFSVELADKTWMDKEIEFDPKQIVLMPKEKIMYKLNIR